MENTQRQIAEGHTPTSKKLPTPLFHRHGGQITILTSFGHDTDQNGCPHWFMRGDVKWNDGGTSTDTEITPNMLCYDSDNEIASRKYLDAIMIGMNDYLVENGKWLDEAKELKGGYLIYWMPHAKKGNAPIALSKLEGK